MPDLTLDSALGLDSAELADLMTRGFEDYVVPVKDTAERMATRLRFDSVDLSLSRVARDGDELVGLALLAPRGWSCRLAAMGVAKSWRRSGVGRLLMRASVDELRRRGYRRLLLEVVEQNDPAVALYLAEGLKIQRRLVGWQLDVASEDLPESRPGDRLAPVDPWRVARAVAAEDADLPWQVDAESLATYGPPNRAYELDGKAFAIIGDPAQPTIPLHALFTSPEYRCQGWGRRLLTALLHRHSAERWQVPPRVPEGLGSELLTSLGFELLTVSQHEMSIAL